MSAYVVNIFLGFGGFFLAYYLNHKKKRKKEQFICPLKGNCSEVIQSNFSRFLGLPVEKLGLTYYLLIAVGYGVSILFPSLDEVLLILLFFLSTFALMFSLYLTFIQIFTLRKFCTWCLLSAAITAGIFGISMIAAMEFINPFFAQYKEIIILLHVLSMAIGLGAATFSDIFFFKFLKDFRFSEKEASVLNTFSQIIWLALGIIVMTGLGLYLPNAAVLNETPKFLVKVIVVAILIVNGALLNLFVAPKFLHIRFGKNGHEHVKKALLRIRRLAFMLGPISIISWYTAFILGSIRPEHATFWQIFAIYLGLIAVGIFIGLLFEHRLDKKADQR